jgi:3,4-dehydroadipyl-CoA semialdehyde dehydrogenase
MSSALQSYLAGSWKQGEGIETELKDPVTGSILATASAKGLDLGAALTHARERSGPLLQELSFGERAKLLGQIADVLAAKRSDYEQIAIANSGNTRRDAAIDIDGAIGTLKYYARQGAGLGEARVLLDQGPVRLAKEENFQAIHLLTPRRGVAMHINAFNFPSWGLWEKAAVALLAGIPVLAKPASSTALLANTMARDVIAAGVLPEGALSILCGSAGDLLAQLASEDVIAFTGSQETARRIRADHNVIERSIALNVEADSLNAAILGPDAAPSTPVFTAFVREVVREMTVKAGQKCTAIRRILVPSEFADAATQALVAELGSIAVGDPRRDDVRMGPLATKAQQEAVFTGIRALLFEAEIVCGSDQSPQLDGISQGKSAFASPTLLRVADANAARLVHEIEIFGPVATILPYANQDQLARLVRRGGGSLVASIFSADLDFLVRTAQRLSPDHGRILAVDPSISAIHTGHGIVMPQCNHGGPGRAGGGQELGGLEALRFYHQRVAIQGATVLLDRLRAKATSLH